jgi:hypothetical protein
MQKVLKGKFADVFNFLPKALFTETGGRRLELEISAIALTSKSNTQRLVSCIARLIDLWLHTKEGIAWTALTGTYQVAVPLILEGLHRTVTEKGKNNKDVVRVKKPKRPSKRLEVLSPYEAKLIRGSEQAFDDYKAKIKTLGKVINISDIKKAREDLKVLIISMWNCVEKFSAPLTKRRTVFTAHLSESDRKRLNFNKQYIEMLRASNFRACIYDKSHIYTLSPIPLINKADDKLVIYTNKIIIENNNIVIPDDAEPIRELLMEFAIMIGFKHSNIITKTKQRKPTHSAGKSNWDVDNVSPEEEKSLFPSELKDTEDI